MDKSSEEIPLSRKRHHSRSRSRSKSPSAKEDEQDLKRKKIDKDEIIVEHDSVSDNSKEKESEKGIEKSDTADNTEMETDTSKKDDALENKHNVNDSQEDGTKTRTNTNEESNSEVPSDEEDKNSDNGKDDTQLDDSITLSSDSEALLDKKEAPIVQIESNTPTRKVKQNTPNRKLTPKLLQKKLESEKKQQERLKEKEERMKKRLEEKLKREELKLKEKEMKKIEKDKELEQKRKEKEEKEEKKRKEREEKEQKRKEKEEKEEQKRKEREEEKQKKMLEIEEKNKEKLKEEEKKQKAAAAFVNFFVPKKADDIQDDKKVQSSNFLQFEIKSDMKLPLPRRELLSKEEKEQLEALIKNQNKDASYLKDLSSGKTQIRKSLRTWPCEEAVNDDDVIIVDLGETIFEDKTSVQKYKVKFLYFHENRRPAYYGTWRKKSKCIKPRKPIVEDTDILNYEEDSDDDWEEEEQGESLNGSDDEAEKENDDEKDDYEVDNEFFVPHGHLSDDEVDDEEITRLSPESHKQKLKLLKEEFDQDMKCKTHKLKPRSIGCIWYNRDGSNVEEAVDRYLQPLTIIARSPIIIKKRVDIFVFKERKNKVPKELDPELFPLFLKFVHGNSNKKRTMAEQFLTDMEKTGSANNVSKNMLINVLKDCAKWEKYRDKQAKRYKFRWSVHQNLREKYNLEPTVDNK